MLKKNQKAYKFKITSIEVNKQRLDNYLALKIPEISRNYFQKLIENNEVLVNSNPVNKNFKLSEGDIVEIKNISGAEGHNDILPQKINLKIRYEDDYILIISKDPGTVVHPAPGNYSFTVANAILYYLKKKHDDFNDYNLRPGIIHRLDKDTSGLMVIAKNSNIQRKISELFKTRQVLKAYKALVLGSFKESKGLIDLPLGRSRIDRKKIEISAFNGKNAQTEFEIEDSLNACSLLNVYPKTGRTHQIRVHFSFIGHPVIGDKTYGNKETDCIANLMGLKRQFLHSYLLTFIHPVYNNKIEIIDKLPDDLADSLKILKNLRPSSLS